MCGRFTLSYKANELQLSLGITDIPAEWEPRYNIAPTQPIPAVLDPKSKKLEFLYWGLVPGWAKDLSIGSKMIDARSETITEKPSFKNSFLRRRCLILADGFYEWKRNQQNKSSVPYYFQLKDKSAFALAGIYDIWQPPDGGELWSAAIITSSANDLVAPIHERMPVILDRQKMWEWLQDLPVQDLKNMLMPYEAGNMSAVEVSKKVNSGRIDDPDCIQPIQGLFG